MRAKDHDRRLGALLEHDHERLEELLEKVMEAVGDGDEHAALAAWRPFEAGILAHFSAEETKLFPELEKLEKDEAEQLEAEHGEIRTRIADLGMRLELHTARKLAFDQLAALIERHAEREEALLYRWAERHVPRHVAASVRRALECIVEQAAAVLHEHPALR